MAKMPLASVARNCRQDGDCGEQDRDRVGKGAPIELAETRMPRPRSSPWINKAPAPVLSGDPDDGLDELNRHGRPTRATRGSPAPPFAPRALGADKGASLA